MQRPREQIAQHQPPVIQRRSLPPDQQGILIRHRQQSPVFNTEQDDALYPQRMPSSAIRYTDSKGNPVIQSGKKRIVLHDEPPPKRRVHWLLLLGIGMVLTIGLYALLNWCSNWLTNYQLDATYGMPRTSQMDAIVYPGDSAEHPSHYIFLNLNGVVEIIELPHGDSSHARIYKGPTLFSDDASRIPVTGELRNVGGKVEMLLHIQKQVIVYVNDGTQFKPQ